MANSLALVRFNRLTRGFRPVVLFASTALSTWVSLHWFSGHTGFLGIWPSNAIALGITLPVWRRDRRRFDLLIAAALGSLAAMLLNGMPAWVALWLCAVSAVELGATCSILGYSTRTFEDFKQVWNVLRFFIVALLVAAGSAELAARPILALLHTSLFEAWLRVGQADMLGLFTVFPAAFFLASGKFRSPRRLRPHLTAVLFWTFIFTAVTIVVFYQTRLPLLFLVFPPLIGLVLAVGAEGAAFAALLVVVSGGWFTDIGHGPIALIAHLSRSTQLSIFRFYAAMVAIVGFPVGALVDERRRADREVREAQTVYHLLLRHSEDMIVLYSFNTTRRFVSPAVLKVTGWTEEEFLGFGPDGPVHESDREIIDEYRVSIESGDERPTARFRILCKDGTYRWVQSTAIGYKGADNRTMEGYVATIRDISDEMERELAWTAERAAMAREQTKLHDLAWKDELTGIANRRAFNQLLAFEGARGSRSGSPLSVLLIDVDLFKQYNDLYGHPAGDRCLQQIATALRAAVARVTDTPSRIGGEEFAIVLASTDAAGALHVAEKVLESILRLNLPHSGSPIGQITVSIGTATIPVGSRASTDTLLQTADAALYKSKQGGRNRVTQGETIA